MKKELEKYLPLGTVVKLKKSTKRVMIIGFCPVPQEDTSTIYDYTASLYPEGLISSNQILLFNHDQIDEIYHLGLIDPEQIEFNIKLKEVMENKKKESKKKTSKKSEK